MQWTRASERLPEVRKEVYIEYVDGKTHKTAGWRHEDEYFIIFGFGSTRDIEKITWLDESPESSVWPGEEDLIELQDLINDELYKSNGHSGGTSYVTNAVKQWLQSRTAVQVDDLKFAEKAFAIGYLNADFGDKQLIDVLPEEIKPKWERCREWLIKLGIESRTAVKAEAIPEWRINVEILDALIDLYEEMPCETENADWWPDQLKKAMQNAEKIIDKYSIIDESQPTAGGVDSQKDLLNENIVSKTYLDKPSFEWMVKEYATGGIFISKWTKVSDVYPHDQQIVIALTNRGNMDICRFVKKDEYGHPCFFNSMRSQHSNGDVEYWMNIPLTPKEESAQTIGKSSSELPENEPNPATIRAKSEDRANDSTLKSSHVENSEENQHSGGVKEEGGEWSKGYLQGIKDSYTKPLHQEIERLNNELCFLQQSQPSPSNPSITPIEIMCILFEGHQGPYSWDQCVEAMKLYKSYLSNPSIKREQTNKK